MYVKVKAKVKGKKLLKGLQQFSTAFYFDYIGLLDSVIAAAFKEKCPVLQRMLTYFSLEIFRMFFLRYVT